MYLRQFLWNTLDRNWLIEIVFVVQLQTLLEIPYRKKNFGEISCS